MNKETLKQILDLHLFYLSSNGQEGKCANLQGASLENAKPAWIFCFVQS